MTINQTIQELTDGHTKFNAVLEKLTDEQLNEIEVLGEWTVKDIIAHLSAWHEIVSGEIVQILSGQTPITFNLSDEEIDSLNERSVNEREDMTLEKALEEWEANFTAVIENLEQLTDKDFQNVIDSKNDRDVSIAEIFEYKYDGLEHQAAHAKQIADYFDLSSI